MHSSLATRLAVVAGLLAAPILAGCGGSSGADQGSGTRVAASFYPLAYVAQRVAGERAQVTNLTSPGQEPHDLELSVRQTAEVSEADVVVFEAGIQPAVDEAVEQSDSEHVVDAAEVVDLLPVEDGEHADEHSEEHAHEEAEEHDHGDLDPHFWLDPTRLATVADAVEEQLAQADPDHAEDYATNAAALREDLAQLDQDLRTGLADCRIDTVVVSHDAFGYLGERYGLDLVSINGLTPDAEPSPAHLRELQDLIREKGITTVFSEELATPEFAESLASDLGIETAVLDPVEGRSDETADEDYLSLMRNNLAALQKANRCR